MAAAHKMAAARRRRLLPAWMGAAGEGERRAGICPVAVPRAATVYCMNEAELVDVALGVLAEVSPRLPFTPSAAAWPRPGPAGEKARSGSTACMEEGSDHSPGPPSSSGASTDAERTGLDDSDDDALKYVREIFFT
uniref:Cell cycle regulator of NHEJ n=1 Tax=Phasianus colchicus TaxID=9054 RepID=A0A669PTA9_PHACC